MTLRGQYVRLTITHSSCPRQSPVETIKPFARRGTGQEIGRTKQYLLWLSSTYVSLKTN
jgi:hypothetical protein